eukprot:gb/GEZN01006316.1/.p1 GENE.gb/GEZN01006316.1/~~gb/GEZN01006316.1/.p1  ORF type:complete len:531 (-),score=37.96 gb/GEZN01006316.1/:87-1499(-)
MYCSQEHQKLDFPSHKAICKAIHALDATGPSASAGSAGPGAGDKKSSRVHNETQRYHRIIRDRTELARILKRPLFSREISLTIFRPTCQVCCVRAGEVIEGSGQKAVLTKCTSCHITLFCKEHLAEGQREHRQHCATYEVVLKCGQIIRDFQLKRENLTWVPDGQDGLVVHEKSYQKLYPSWDRYWKRRRAPVMMYSPLLKLFSTHLSLPLTLLWAMSQPAVATLLKADTVSSLTVHFIGATASFELQFVEKYEEIMHLLPGLRVLNLVFVGPELPIPKQDPRTPARVIDDLGMQLTYSLCGSCPEGNEMRLFSFRSTYDHLIQRWEKDSKQFDYRKADVLVALNSGVHLFAKGSTQDSWHSTLTLLAKQQDAGRPIIWTAYSKDEAILTAARLESYGARFLLAPQENPFRSLLPSREPTGLLSSPFYYHNGQVMLTQGFLPPQEVQAHHEWRDTMEKLPHLDLIRQSQV